MGRMMLRPYGHLNREIKRRLHFGVVVNARSASTATTTKRTTTTMRLVNGIGFVGIGVVDNGGVDCTETVGTAVIGIVNCTEVVEPENVDTLPRASAAATCSPTSLS